jgi:hypothetical protein
MKSALNLHALYAPYVGEQPFQTRIADYPDTFQSVFTDRALAERCFAHPSVLRFLDTKGPDIKAEFVRLELPEQFVRDCLSRGVRVVLDITFTGEDTAEWGEIVDQGGSLFRIDTRPA